MSKMKSCNPSQITPFWLRPVASATNGLDFRIVESFATVDESKNAYLTKTLEYNVSSELPLISNMKLLSMYWMTTASEQIVEQMIISLQLSLTIFCTYCNFFWKRLISSIVVRSFSYQTLL